MEFISFQKKMEASRMNEIKDFPTEGCTVALWVFKAARTRAFSVSLSEDLMKEFRTIKNSCLAQIKDCVPYDSGAAVAKDTLTVINGDIDQWSKILQLITAPVEKRHVRSISGLQNNLAYVVVFSFNGRKLYAIKKTSSQLGSKKSKKFFDTLFDGAKLDVAENLVFGISRYFDFFYLEENFFILDRNNFESVLGYKDHYKKNFKDLLNDKNFNSKIDNLKVLESYVSENAIQLGRMSAIKEKKKYEDPIYWNSFIGLNSSEGWGISVTDTGKIIISEEKVKDIVSILLGHRVKSLCDREISDASGLMQIKR